MKKLLVLHEYGAPEHYTGARAAADKLSIGIEYKEFSTLKLVLKACKNFNVAAFTKAIKDFLFLFFCFCFPRLLKDRVVILGCAPLDWRLIIFTRVLKYSRVIYHTSWLCWDGTKYAKQPKFAVSYLKKNWENFLINTTAHIAVVTPQVAQQLCEYMSVPKKKVTVVYHSFDNLIFNSTQQKQYSDKLNILFVGRLLPEKGIKELLEFAKILPDCNFTVIGKGKLENLINEQVQRFSNLKFLGFIANRQQLAEEYKKADILLQPSIRSNDWEELFGMAIIEGMACGAVAITSDHIGPKTIFENSKLSENIVAEQDLLQGILDRIRSYISDPEQLSSDKKISATLAKTYCLDEITKHWLSIFRKI